MEGHAQSGRNRRSVKIIGGAWMALAICCLAFVARDTNATQILLSTSGSAELGGLSFEDDDLILFDTSTELATLYFDSGLFRKDEDIDAVSVLANGNIVLSTRTDAVLGGLEFRDGDLVEYDPFDNTATLYFDENRFAASEEVSAFDVLANGNLLISTRGNAKLAGLKFKDGDVVEYDPVNHIASLFFSESLFTGNADINALDLLGNGNLLLSTRKKATLGGLTFGDDDLIEYNPVTNQAFLFFDGSLFSDGYEDIDAVHVFESPVALRASLAIAAAVPEPATLMLLCLGLSALAWSRRSRPLTV